MKCECSTKQRTRYRHWITVESISGTADASGHIDLSVSSNWSSAGKIKGNFISRGGRESFKYDQVQVDASHIVETPSTTFSRSINETYRLSFNSRIYNILLADDVDQARETVRLYLTEVK